MNIRRLIPCLALASMTPTPPVRAQTPSQAGATLDDAALSTARRIELSQPPQPPEKVGVLLSPDLGDAADRLRSLLKSAGVRETDEPSDFELTTKRNYPQTLIMVNRGEREASWRFRPAEDAMAVERVPTTIELGNLMTGDYAAPLQAALRRIQRARAVVRLAQSTTATTLTCLSAETDVASAPTCHDSSGYRVTGDEAPAAQTVKEGNPATISVRNTSDQPLYVKLLLVDPDNELSELPLSGTMPLPPGAWAAARGFLAFASSGDHVLVTIASPRPLAADTDAPQGASVDLYRLLVNPQTVIMVGGGAPVIEGMAPWMAELYSTVPYTLREIAADAVAREDKRQYLWRRSAAERGHRCGGSLIAPDLVLTAAHCVAKGDFAGANAVGVLTRRRIRVGTVYLASGGTTYAIDALAVHAGYVAGRTLDDIALLRLKADRDSRPMQLPLLPLPGASAPAVSADGLPLVAFGWGFTGVVAPNARTVTDFNGDVQRNPGVLQFGQLQTLDWQQCRARMGSDLGKDMLCAVSRVDPATGIAPRKVFSCVGDSGGPLTMRVGGADVLVGIASWSRGCGYGDYPSVYTNVESYAGWIARARLALKSGAAVRVGDVARPAQ